MLRPPLRERPVDEVAGTLDPMAIRMLLWLFDTHGVDAITIRFPHKDYTNAMCRLQQRGFVVVRPAHQAGYVNASSPRYVRLMKRGLYALPHLRSEF